MLPYQNLSIEDMDGEIWKPIPNYEQFYHVSNMGRVKALRRPPFVNRVGGLTKEYPERILKQIYSNGYVSVKLCKDNKVKPTNVNRIVLLAFVDNPQNKPYTNHINGIRNDNRLENLEWVTASENSLHSCRVLGNVVSGIESPHNEVVYQYTKDGVFVEKHPSISLAAIKMGLKRTAISACCNGRTKSSCKYIWSKVEL